MAEPPPAPLWTPSPPRIANSRLADLTGLLARRSGQPVLDYESAHRISIDEPDLFWGTAWDDCGVTAAVKGADVLTTDGGDPRWFTGARLNLAENLLGRRDEGPALIFRGEDPQDRRWVSWAQLHEDVSVLAQALSRVGVGSGDVVATWLPNVCESVIVMLAATSLGAVFAPASPHVPADDLVARLEALAPRAIFVTDAHRWGGQVRDLAEPLREIVGRLGSLDAAVVVPHVDAEVAVRVPGTTMFGDFCDEVTPEPLRFEQLGFDHPAVITFETGVPAARGAVRHPAGGTLVKHLVEQQYHCDVRSGDRVLSVALAGSTTWTWLVAALASDATVVLVDGDPTYPDPGRIFAIADDVDATLIGAPAGFFEAARRSGVRPEAGGGLFPLRTVAAFTEGADPDVAAWVYDAVKTEVHMSPMLWDVGVGGCVAAGDPTGPVWSDSAGRPALGVAVRIAHGVLVVDAPVPSATTASPTAGRAGTPARWGAGGHISLQHLASPGLADG